jgi:hypothetical protein
MTALRDITAEQEDRIMSLLKKYCQPECACKLVYQRKNGNRTGAVILSFYAIGKAIEGKFKHQFTIKTDGNYTSKTQYKGVI